MSLDLLDRATAERQIVAAEPTFSVWVSANAGAGKTHVLVNRVLRLLLEGRPIGKVLCLTFTKAAAAEMANRLHRELGRWTIASDADLRKLLQNLTWGEVTEAQVLRARQLFARTLEAPGGLQIQTIHAFCQSLLARFPLEAGVAPHFGVLDERSRAELMRSAREEVLARAAAGADAGLAEALATLVVTATEEGFAELVDAMTGSRAKLRRLLDQYGDVDAVLAVTRQALGLPPDAREESLNAAFVAALPMMELQQLARALRKGGKEDQQRAAALSDWLAGDAATQAGRIDRFHQVILTKKLMPRVHAASKAAHDADPQIAEILRQLEQRSLAQVELCRATRTYARTACLWRLGAAVLARFEAAKAESALLDYDDLILLTRRLLEDVGAGWVMYKLDGGIDHILVDEAQDTSPDQWAVIAALAGEFFAGKGAREQSRTVFAVGDEKQSIFSFQGAAPKAFEEMRQHFAAAVNDADLPWRAIELDSSFRSTAVVLQAVDLVFSDPAASDGLSSIAHTVRHRANRRGQGGLVEIWPLLEAEEEADIEPWDAPLDRVTKHDPMAQLARKIAATIKSWIGTEMLVSKGRPVRAGDVMILVRRRNRFFEEMIRALKEQGVAVAGADRMILTDQVAVRDLIALAQFLVLPDDNLSLAETLKGPFFGLSDDDLLQFAPQRTGSLWRALRECGRFDSVVAELKALMRRADRAAPFEFFAELLGAHGGRRRLLTRLGAEANDPVDEFLRLAFEFERGSPPSLQGFLHWIVQAESEVKRDPEGQRDAVRVMTVHGAKGLEANIVFLPDTTGLPDARVEPQIHWQADSGLPLLLWSPSKAEDDKVSAQARAAAAEARLAEYRRLLYVAMTRARDRLYVCGYKGSRQISAGCWYQLIERNLLPQASRLQLPDGSEVHRLSDAQAVPVENERAWRQAGAATALPAWHRRPAPVEPRPSVPLSPSRPSGEEPPSISPLGADDGRRFKRGRILHRLLQSLPTVAAPDRAAVAAAYLGRSSHDLDAAQQAEMLSEAMRVMQDPMLAELFGVGSQPEVPLAGIVGTQVISGQVDRLFVSPDRVIVADFKTNRPPPRKAEDCPRVYVRQMAEYVALLERIYPNCAVEAVLIWTDGPIVMPLPRALLLPAMP